MSKVPILMYHRIGRIGLSRASRFGAITPLQFRGHLKALRDAGFEGICMSALIDGWKGRRPLPEKPIVLTFDDGYSEVFQHALPQVVAYGWNCTVYVISDLIGSNATWHASPEYRRVRLADSAAILQAHRLGIEIGSHSRTHPLLSSLSSDAAKAEIEDSKSQLEALLSSPVRSFCYPLGDETPEIRDWVREAGFDSATTVEKGWASPGHDLMGLPRIAVHSWRLSPKGLLSLIQQCHSLPSKPMASSTEATAKC